MLVWYNGHLNTATTPHVSRNYISYLSGYDYTFKILLLAFKVLHQMDPSYMSDLISITLPHRYNLRSSNNGILLSYPRIRSKKTLADHSFMFADPQLWNNLRYLPSDIRNIYNVSNFKSKLKLVFLLWLLVDSDLSAIICFIYILYF